MSIRLSLTGTFAKPSAEADYQMIADSSPDIPPAVTQSVTGWLQILVGSNGQAATGLQQIDGHWWLFRAQLESTTDSVNRPRGLVVFGRVETELDGETAIGLLHEFCTIRVNRQKLPPGDIDVAQIPNEVLHSDTVAATVLLAIGMSPATIKQPSGAVDILKSIPLSKLPWLGFFPLKRPITVPAGNGLLINPDARSAPNSLQALITKVDSVAILRLPLAGLMSLPDRWEVKLKLIECALGELDHLARETISDAAFWWLADASSVGRAMALRLVDSHLVADWLSSPLASADDLLTLKPHLTEVNQEACALLAERSLKPFEIYARVFPSDPKRLWHLMPPQMKRIDESLQSLSAQLSAEATDQYFEFVAGTVIEGKDTEVLANAVRCGSSKALEKFSARLAESGLSTALVNALLHGYSIDLSEDPPRLLPSQDWILGIDEENWLNLGRELMGNRSWRNWWLNGWRLSFRRGRLDSDRLVAEAIHSRQPDLLKRAGASDTVCNLIDVNAPSVRLMEAATSWDPRYNRLIDEMYADLSLFDRIGDPLTEQFFKWLESCLSSGHAERFRSLYGQLISGECVESRYILALVKLLTRSQRLRQIAVWYQASAGDQRKTVLTELLESASDQLHRDEVDFIQTVVFHCRPLPPLPEWTAGDLNNMLPLIGVEAVIRQVMIRKQVDSTGERLLLASILRKLAAQPRCTPIPPPSPSEQTRRPDWFDALKEYLPDW